MSMDGPYAARSQDGGAAMSMDGLYAARSQDGGAAMSGLNWLSKFDIQMRRIYGAIFRLFRGVLDDL